MRAQGSRKLSPSDAWSGFSSFTAKYTNAGISSSHEVSLQYWCDKLPDWYPFTATDKSKAKVPLGADKSTSTAARTEGGVGPVPYSCFLLGQPGGSDFQDNVPTFGLWRSDGASMDCAITENADRSITFTQASSGIPPANGRWYFINMEAGQAIGAAQLINTAAGDCLTATGGAGTPAVGARVTPPTRRSTGWSPELSAVEPPRRRVPWSESR